MNELKDSESKRRVFDSVYRTSAIGEFITFDKLAEMPEEARESLRQALDVYKTQRRRIKGPIRHLTAQPRDPREWDAYQIYDDQLHEGMVFVFRPSSPVPVTNLKLRGLDGDRSYTIISQNTGSLLARTSGRQLMESGLRVQIYECTGSDILTIRAE
jgi:hypothetical protein